MTFEAAVQWVLGQEGEWNRNPNDGGGATRWGISQRAYPALDLDALTREQAVGLYRRDYWDAARCDELPAPLRLPVFDAVVQHGLRTAVKLLQQSVGAVADGVLGPATLAACQRAAWPDVLVDFLARRQRLYAALGNQAVFGFGWARRVMACQRAVYEAAMKEATT